MWYWDIIEGNDYATLHKRGKKGLHTEAAFKRGLREEQIMDCRTDPGREVKNRTKLRSNINHELISETGQGQSKFLNFIFNKVNCICLYTSEYHKLHTSIINLLR